MHFTDPLELFRAAVEAYIAGDYPAVARLVDPVSLRAYKRQLLNRFEPRVRPRLLTAEDILESSPEMPRAVAEYQVAQYRQSADPAAQLKLVLPGVSSLDQLRALDADQVLVTELEGRSIQRHIERAVAEEHVGPEALHAVEELRRLHLSFAAIGVVEDGPSIAYVVYRLSALEGYATTREFEDEIATLPTDEQQLAREMIGREQPRYAICRRQPDGGWLLHADYDFLSLGSGYVSIGPVHAADTDPESSGGA
jgi:hypothetical protein